MADGSVSWMHSQLRTETKKQQQQASDSCSKQASASATRNSSKQARNSIYQQSSYHIALGIMFLLEFEDDVVTIIKWGHC